MTEETITMADEFEMTIVSSEDLETSRPKISDGYLLVMEDGTPDPLRLADFVEDAPEWAFIQAKVLTPAENRRVQKAAMRARLTGFSGGNRAQRRGKQDGGDQEITLDIDTDGAFIEQCLVQITDYALAVRSKSGEIVARKYDPTQNGNNAHNRASWERLLRPEFEDFQKLVWQYLSYANGTDNEAAEDFAALKNARRS